MKNQNTKYTQKRKVLVFKIKENSLLLTTVVTSSTNSSPAAEIVNQCKECSNHQKRKKPRKRKLETNLKTKNLQEEEVLDPLGKIVYIDHRQSCSLTSRHLAIPDTTT